MRKLIVTIFATLMLAAPGLALADQGSSEPKPSESPAVVVDKGGDVLPETGSGTGLLFLAAAATAVIAAGGVIILMVRR